MSKKLWGTNLDQNLNIRVKPEVHEALNKRAKALDTDVSNLVREILDIYLEAEAQTRSQPKPKPVVRHVIRAKRPEDMTRPEYQEHVASNVDNLLRSKGLEGRKKEKPGLKNYPGYSSKK